MIVVDSSALVTILLDEPERTAFEDVMIGGEECIMSAVNAHETATVMRMRHGPEAVQHLRQYLGDSGMAIASLDEEQVHLAAVAFGIYGKGVNPKSRLNLCDCAAYALAKTMDAPLLFKGDDFTHTDLRAAL